MRCQSADTFGPWEGVWRPGVRVGPDARMASHAQELRDRLAERAHPANTEVAVDVNVRRRLGSVDSLAAVVWNPEVRARRSAGRLSESSTLTWLCAKSTTARPPRIAFGDRRRLR
ncbi:MAG: hypothetical protein HW416_3494 [Chloroflexi bacterium]|nr:hypothetical protein [Chloroflexota bacterium]